MGDACIYTSCNNMVMTLILININCTCLSSGIAFRASYSKMKMYVYVWVRWALYYRMRPEHMHCAGGLSFS